MESTPSCSSTSQKCTSCGGVEVSGWCVECVDALCEQCVLAHRRVKMTRCHTIKTQPSLGQPSSGGRYCPIHTSELLQLYCFTCYRMTCRDCQLMDHQNHRYQFVHEVLENQRKVLDQLVESVGQQRQTVTQSLMDMDARLQVIKENKFALRKKLQETFIVFCQQFKQRLFSLSNDVEIAYQTEMDGIENRKKYLMALEEKRQHVEQCIDNARNTEDLPTLLAYITQVNKLKELLSKDVSPPQSMIHLALLVNKAAFNTLGSFGKLVVSAIPFSCSQNRPQDPPSITAVQHQDTAVAHTSSCPAPPCKPLPQTGNAKYADSSNPVNYLSSQRTLSNQPCPPPSSRPSLCQLNTDGTTSTSVYPTSYDQSPPTSDAQMSLDLQTNPRQSASVLAIQTQPTVFPTNQTQPTVFPTNQTQPTVFPTNQTQPTVFPTNQTQPTVFPTNQTQPTVFPTNYTQPTVFPTNYTQPTVFPTNYTQPISTSACVQCPDGNLDLPPSDTNQPSAASLSASSPHCPPPSPTVKAVADSACDVSAPCVGDVSAATGHQAAENEPTSTVSESHIPEQVLSELSSLWDDINASISLDSDPDLMPSEGSSSEEPAVSPGPVLGETPQETGGTAGSHTEPGVKPSSGKLNCKAELMSCDEVASPVVEYPGTSARTRWLKQEPDAENQETKTDLANIPLGNPSGPYLAHEIQSMKTNCEELGSADEHPAYIWREWQPRVCLFRLPISTLRPGQPSPRFLLLPGDTKNEIHLQEIDDDDQSHADDIMDFLEPLSSPETPALLQAVTCAVCRCPNASVVCGPCGRGFHRDCHIPPTGPSLCSEWICSLCQDLDEPWDPYSTDRPKRRCLSLLDQRKCEHILLYLTCEISSDVWGSEVSCGSSHLSLIQERLSQQCSPPYRTPTEFISDVWVFFQTLSLSKENSEVLNHLQDSFHNKLLEIFGRELHPSLLQLHSVAHTEEVREAGPDYLPPCENNNQTETAGGAEESAVMTYTNTNQMERNLCVPGGAEPEASNSLVSNDGLTEVGGTEGSKVMWTPGGLVSEGRASLVEKDKLKETRKRLRQFLNCLPPAKKPTMSRKAEPPSY
ncbi:uncharacterized protein trim33l isoform 2-T2 [Polymixia lowei]